MGPLETALVADGWEVAVDDLDTSEGVELHTRRQLETMTDPFRMRLLTSLARRPGSVKDLAGRFEVPATRLYHHVNRLEEDGLLRVVATRPSGARTERCYGLVGDHLRVGSELLADGGDEAAKAIANVVAAAGAVAAEAVRAGLVDLALPSGSPKPAVLASFSGRLTEAQQMEVAEELEAMIRRIRTLADENLEARVPADLMRPMQWLLLQTPDPLMPG